jgi:uncharacterized protein
VIFEITAEKSANNTKTFYYDNHTNVLKSEDGLEYKFPNHTPNDREDATKFSKTDPLKKSNLISTLKIQLGLGCNYSCEYCSQKFVERADSTSAKDIEAFMAKLNVLEFDEEKGLHIELWGGEPLVYWKTLKPLTAALQDKFRTWTKKPVFSIITNGSILTDEIIDWLIDNKFSVAISHDGPGQHVRGPDPFDDPEAKDRILKFYYKMKRLNRPFSFNSMLSAKNMSRKAISDWFINLTGDRDVSLGEGSIVDAYDEDGITNSLQTKQEHFNFRRQAFFDIYSVEGDIAFKMQLNKINGFTADVLGQVPSRSLGQKCGMDGENVLAVDLHGNVITCQNVSAVETSMNGESHLAGTLMDYDNVKITTSTHWSNRKECSGCPVLHLCKGACMFLDNKYWETSCANAYSDNVALFALSFAKMTGYIPTLIKHEDLPLERQDIFGTIFEHKETAPKKVIPIKVVSQLSDIVDDVAVYGKATVL